MEEKSRMLKFQNILIYYFVCSIIGWILEMIYGYTVYGHFVERGFLYGPICPIYGYGAVLMILIEELTKKKDLNSVVKFLRITIMFTVLEYLTSFILEVLFNQRWWDYSNEFLNLNGRVCLVFSLMFGIIGTAFLKFVYTPSKNIINKIREKTSSKLIWVVLIISIVVYFLDTTFSVIKNVI